MAPLIRTFLTLASVAEVPVPTAPTGEVEKRGGSDEFSSQTKNWRLATSNIHT